MVAETDADPMKLTCSFAHDDNDGRRRKSCYSSYISQRTTKLRTNNKLVLISYTYTMSSKKGKLSQWDGGVGKVEFSVLMGPFMMEECPFVVVTLDVV